MLPGHVELKLKVNTLHLLEDFCCLISKNNYILHNLNFDEFFSYELYVIKHLNYFDATLTYVNFNDMKALSMKLLDPCKIHIFGVSQQTRKCNAKSVNVRLLVPLKKINIFGANQPLRKCLPQVIKLSRWARLPD